MQKKRQLIFNNMDILLLILNMLISHKILGTPLFGAEMFLFSNILFILRNANVRRLTISNRNILMSFIIIFSLASASFYFVFFPSMSGINWYYSPIFLIINYSLLFVKDYTYKIISDDDFVIPENSYAPFSLKVFHNMMLFSRLSLITGILMIISYLSFQEIEFSLKHYIIVGLWIFMVGLLYYSFNHFVKPDIRFSIFIFIVGAALWIVATILFYKSSTFANLISILLFSVALSLISSSLSRFNKDFGLVLRLAGEEDVESKIGRFDRINIVVSSLLSSCMMILIITIWSFVMPDVNNWEVTNLFSGMIIQIPVIFMLISIYYALNQPLDSRTKEKLENYFAVSNDDEMRVSLYKILIKKYRVRYGVKIIATFLRPWLHLKVVGKENVISKDFPSVFVCNHGIIYGPVAAVIYLPTYFRPWIDRKMLDIELATEEMYSRFMYRVPLFGEKFKKRLANFLAYPVVWAMNSFNPIGVERDNLRNVMTTFNDTIKALKESDNILLFPERPAKKVISGKETMVHSTDSVGNLFKGFAKLGNMYWKETGRCLAFYPIYADKENHTFTIGEAVVYEPNNNVNDERDRIAEELKTKMQMMVERC